MLVKKQHRVDCNPIFVERGKNSEGICVKIAGQDVHWVHDEQVATKATKLYSATGRKINEDYYFSGFSTSDIDERKLWRYSSEELKRVVGQTGFKADQHFQATWKDPKDEPIEPYEVIIFLSDDVSSYYTFFKLPLVVPIGVC